MQLSKNISTLPKISSRSVPGQPEPVFSTRESPQREQDEQLGPDPSPVSRVEARGQEGEQSAPVLLHGSIHCECVSNQEDICETHEDGQIRRPTRPTFLADSIEYSGFNLKCDFNRPNSLAVLSVKINQRVLLSGRAMSAGC